MWSIQYLGNTTSTLAISLIVLGSAVFLISFCGICGAITENAVVLLIVSNQDIHIEFTLCFHLCFFSFFVQYVTLLTILVIVEIAMGIVAAVNKDQVREYLDNELLQSFDGFVMSGTYAMFWNKFQIEVKII